MQEIPISFPARMQLFCRSIIIYMDHLKRLHLSIERPQSPGRLKITPVLQTQAERHYNSPAPKDLFVQNKQSRCVPKSGYRHLSFIYYITRRYPKSIDLKPCSQLAPENLMHELFFPLLKQGVSEFPGTNHHDS